MPEQIYVEIGKRIRQQRQVKGMSQRELANRLLISRASLANIEVGRQRVYLHHIYQIAQVLDMSPDHLLLVTSQVGRDFIWL